MWIVKTATFAAAAILACAGVANAKPRLSADLGPPPPAGAHLASGQCFRSQDIRNHTYADDRTLLLNVRDHSVYRVTMSGACLAGTMPSDPIITRSPPGSQIICRPLDLDIGVGRSGFETRCIVDSIVKLTPEQVAALPKKLKP